ncbi:MAG: FHA domain-containing protein [Pseudomonadales bacterium]|jgi:predicted component of type VI protein secretion system|nr:FHA domain-containing protein [Pseudomonadales bacterium]
MPVRLVLSLDARRLSVHALEREVFVIGRRPDCDLVLDDPAVSALHARLLTVGDACSIEDLNSTNGTFVNGHRVTRQSLSHGDLLALGRHRLRFERAPDVALAPSEPEPDAGPAPAPQPKPRPEAPAEAASAVPPVADDDFSAPLPPRPSLRPARLRVLSAEGAGRELRLEKELTRLGRAGVQVGAISRRPGADMLLILERGEGEAPPRVNGEVVAGRARALADGDVIEVAGTRVAYLRD